MTDICRLCASLKIIDQLHSQLGSQPNLRIFEKLNRCCSLELIDDELLPQMICQECVLSLNCSWNFAEKVCQAQEILKKAFIIETVKNGDSEQGSAFDGKLSRNKLQSFDQSSNSINELSLRDRSMIISLLTKGYSGTEISNKLNLNIILVNGWIQMYGNECKKVDFKFNDGSQFLHEKNHLQENILIEENVSHAEAIIEREDVTDVIEHKMENEESNHLSVDTAESNHLSVDTAESNHLSVDTAESKLNQNIHSHDDRDQHFHTKSDELIAYTVNEISEDEHSDSEEIDVLSFAELNDDDKNDDGSISQYAVEKLKVEAWNDYPWNCNDCGIQMADAHDLRQHHISSHQSRSKYYCVDCPKIFNKYATFLRHVRLRHRSHLKYCCDICSTFFWNSKSLQHHRSEHSDKDRSYLCQTCGKGFRCNSTLQVHCRSHLPSDLKNKYNCDVCFKKFGTKPNLQAHKRIHSGVRDYTCEQCGKGFVQKGNLENHMLTHFQNKPFSCDCGKTFKTQLRLMKHKTVHTDLKPHKCQSCGKEFREKGTLKEHMRIHLGMKPFSCEFCSKKFRFKGVLTTHRRQHTGERPYSCIECNHHFTNWPNYNKHMKRRHGINTSVTVRKPQLIPPSGIPPTKLNHVVPTVHNTAYVQQASILTDSSNGHIANNEMIETICEKDVVCVNANNYTTTAQEVVVNRDDRHNENVSRKSSSNQHGSHITILTHPNRDINQQVLTTSSSNQLTPQYNYLPAGSTMLGFYNIQGVDLIQNSHVQQ